LYSVSGSLKPKEVVCKDWHAFFRYYRLKIQKTHMRPTMQPIIVKESTIMARFCSQSNLMTNICSSMNIAQRIAETIETIIGTNGLSSLSVTTTHLHICLLVWEFLHWRTNFRQVSILNYDSCFITVNSFPLTYQVSERHNHA